MYMVYLFKIYSTILLNFMLLKFYRQVILFTNECLFEFDFLMRSNVKIFLDDIQFTSPCDDDVSIL